MRLVLLFLIIANALGCGLMFYATSVSREPAVYWIGLLSGILLAIGLVTFVIFYIRDIWRGRI